MGTADNSSISPETKGIIPRAMETLFASMNSLQCKNQKFSIKVSFIEIYNEDLIDLLGEGDMESRSQVTIREDSKGNILWNGLQEIKVNGVEDVMSHLARGSMNRQVGATEMNSKSSRSHAIFSVIMAQQKYVGSSPTPPTPPTSSTPPRPSTPSRLSDSSRIARSSSNLNLRMSRRFDEGDWVTVTSKFHFVDLAGSERLKRTSAVGERAKEGISINGGLLALGNVISALGDPNKAKHVTHVPYRDSKLTRLLQDSLGGNANTLMIACVSSSESNLNETINTLKYANRARNIKNSISINQEESGWNDLEHLQSLVLKLRSEIKSLKAANSANSTNGTNSGTNSGINSGRNSSSNSSGRNTPIPSNNTPETLSENQSIPVQSIPVQSMPVTIVTDVDGNKSNPELEMLEEQLIHLQRSYSELSQKYAKTSAELAMHQDNDEHFDNSLIEKEKKLIKRASDSFQEAVEPVIEEYEKLISSLESQLALTRAALNHTETMIRDQDTRLEHAEQINDQYKNLINDLRNNIAQLSERESSNENYIKDLESKLETHNEDHNNDQLIINELKSKISQLKSTSVNSEGYIKDLEARLEESERQLIEINQTVERLENKLKEKEDAYTELKDRFDQAESDQDKTLLLNELNDRDRRIALLEQKTDELSSELSKLKNIKLQEVELDNHQEIIAGFSSASDEEKLLFSSIAPGTLSLKDEQDRLIVASLEIKLSELQQTHEKTVIEFTQIKAKYQACLDEIHELQTQLTEARLIDAEMMDDFKSISSTPLTPMSPASVMGPMGSPVTARQSLPPSMRFDELEKEYFNSEKDTPRTKTRSYSMGGGEKSDLIHIATVQRLQMELRQLESLHDDKKTGLDSVRQEFARLEMSHRANLEIVEELRNEIKRRDALAQIEVMSMVKSDRPHSCSELDELEVVHRLREEVKNLRKEQRKTLDLVAEREKDYHINDYEIIKIELNIQELRDSLQDSLEKKNDINDIEFDKTIETLKNSIKNLEDQLFKAKELRLQSENENSQLGENVRPLQISKEVAAEMISLRKQVDKLQIEIEAKNHAIAALLLPNNENQIKIKELEEQLNEARQAHRHALEKNNQLVKISESVVDRKNHNLTVSIKSCDEMSSDKLEQNVDENIELLEEKVRDLEEQLIKAKEAKHVPIFDALNIVDPTQKSIEVLEEKLVALQEELSSKSDTIQNLQNEKSLVVALRAQLETLKLDIKRKYELIEILKRDSVDKGILQQKLRDKESEAVILNLQLSEVKSRQEETQNQMKDLQLQLKKVENIGADQLLHLEIENVRKELQIVKDNEASALEKIRILDAKETKLNEELHRSRNIEIAQRERIILLESQLSSQNSSIDDDIIRLRNELFVAKESEASYKRTILDLESKLEKSELEFSTLRAKIDTIKSRTIAQKDQIQSHESQLSKMLSSLDSNVDSQQIKVLNKEIENLRSQDLIQRKKIDTLESRLKLIKQDSKTDDIKREIFELKEVESNLKNTIEDLENKLEISQKECEDLRTLRSEIKFLKEFESEQKSTIEQLQSQLNDTTKSKDVLILELESLKKEHDTKNERIIFLEEELKTVKEELLQANDKNLACSKEIIELKNLLNDASQKRDKEQRKIKELEVELQEIKNVDITGNNNIKFLKEELASAKIEMDVQNDLIADLKTKLLEVEKERDKHVEYAKEQTKVFESKEIEHKNEISELQCSITNLQTELVKVKSSSQNDQTTIANLGNELATVGSLLSEAKAAEEERAKFAVQLEVKLKQADCDLKVKDQMLSIKDEHIIQLESQIQENKVNLETAKLQVTTESENVKKLQSTLSELEAKLQSVPSSEEMAATKAFAEKQSQLVKELESKLANIKSQSSINTATSIGSIAMMTAELEEKRQVENTQTVLIQELEVTLKGKQDALDKLQETMQEINYELEQVKGSDVQKQEFIKVLESKLQMAESNHSSEISRLQEANVEIEILKEQCKRLQNAFDDAKMEVMCNFNNGVNNLTIENLTNQLKQAHIELESHRNRVQELEMTIQKLESDKKSQHTDNKNITQQIGNIQKEFDNLSVEYDKTVRELEKADSSNLTIEKMLIENENLRLTNDRLNAKVSANEEEVNSLKENLKTLRNELEHLHSISDQISMESLQEKISELEAEKEGLEQANKAFFEERKKLDQRIDSLLNQLKERGGNKEVAQLVELNTKLISLEKEHADLKQKAFSEALEMENEIKKLIEINEQLEKEIAQISSKNNKISEISFELSESILPQSHLSADSSINDKLKDQESTISQQNNLIKVFQEKITELERRLQDETLCRRPSICVSEYDKYDSVDRLRYSASSTSSDMVKKIRPNLMVASNLRSPPPTPPPNSPLPPPPVSPQTPSPTTPPLGSTSRLRTSISEGIPSTDLGVEVQKLHKKIAKFEGENVRNRQQIESLENAVSEKDINLRVAKQQLHILQKEKSDLMNQIKELHSQLDETTVQFENTRTSVYQEKKVIEAVLEEERKAKENAEKARQLLESRMEELMARKRSFLHPFMKPFIYRSRSLHRASTPPGSSTPNCI
ncbi:kinesin-domain-containing protein [Gigaspora margarita]|uniref:Kinesin-domain-containing protein n=1 Tax=Gigaspora margarita TaxID=4874 RepID=A0A8H4ABB4_GIGMA|nr:kinesin-domain-containing protein [Gigaspora margarita]